MASEHTFKFTCRPWYGPGAALVWPLLAEMVASFRIQTKSKLYESRNSAKAESEILDLASEWQDSSDNQSLPEDWKKPFVAMAEKIDSLHSLHGAYELHKHCKSLVEIPSTQPTCFVLLIHGFTSCAKYWWPYVPTLVEEEGCLVVAPTLPGHGAFAGGGVANLPGREIGGERHKEAHLYMAWVFRLGLILQEAGINSIQKSKSVAGYSLGGPVATALAFSTGIRWNNILILNPAFEPPNPVGYKLPNWWPVDFDSHVAFNGTDFGWKTTRDVCSKYQDAFMAHDYCRMRGAQVTTIFRFANQVMQAWALGGRFRAESAGAAIGVAKSGDQAPSARESMTQWVETMLTGIQQKTNATDLSREAETLVSNAIAGMQHLATDQAKLQLIATVSDPAVGWGGLQKFYDLAALNANQKSMCNMPKHMDHTWIGIYVERLAWWYASARSKLVEFLVYGQHFPKEGPAPRGYGPLCFIDAMDEESSPVLPFGVNAVHGTGCRTYTSEYVVFEPSQGLPRQEIHHIFKFANIGRYLWRVSRKSKSRTKASRLQLTLQPMVVRYGQGSSHADVKDIKVLVERQVPVVYDRGLLEQTIRRAVVVSPHLQCSRYDMSKSRNAKPKGVPEEEEYSGINGKREIRCIQVPVQTFHKAKELESFAKSLIKGDPTTASAANPRDYVYCGLQADMEKLLTFCTSSPSESLVASGCPEEPSHRVVKLEENRTFQSYEDWKGSMTSQAEPSLT